MISVNGLEWVAQDGGRAIMEGVKPKSVTTGHDLYGRAHAQVSNHEKRKKRLPRALSSPRQKLFVQRMSICPTWTRLLVLTLKRVGCRKLCLM